MTGAGTDNGSPRPRNDPPDRPPRWLWWFCFALMGPAMGINAVLGAMAVPALAPYGFAGMAVAGAIGIMLGTLPAQWLARRIHEGIREDR
jgi:hypothetical protein